MHFTPVQLAALAIAFLAQFSRIFSATKPFWGRLPAAVQIWLPPMLPFVAALQAGLTGAQTWTDFAVVTITSAALLLPGAPSNRSAAPLKAPSPLKPPGVPFGMLMLMCLLALPVSFVGCSLFGKGGAAWPVVQHCLPSPANLIAQVESVLLAGGDYEAALLQLAESNGKDAIVCAVESAVAELGGKVGASESSAALRGKAFLKRTGNK